MAKCPSCMSSRLRTGYRKTPIFLRIFGIRTLLCDNCNCEFRGFSLLPPKQQTRRTVHKADTFTQTHEFNLAAVDQPGEGTRRSPQPVAFDRDALPFNPAAGTTAIIAQAQFNVTNSLRERITEQPVAVPTEEPLMQLRADLEARRQQQPAQICPKCDSPETRRRHRTSWERWLSNVSSVRPYYCESCGTNFYGRKGEQVARPRLSQGERDLMESSCFNQQAKRDDA